MITQSLLTHLMLIEYGYLADETRCRWLVEGTALRSRHAKDPLMHATNWKRWTLALVIFSLVDATTGTKAVTAATPATPATVSAPPDLATFALGGTIRGSGSTFADRLYKKMVFSLKTAAPCLKGFVRFVLTDGQRLAGTVNYAKLPETLRVQALAQLDKIGVGQ